MRVTLTWHEVAQGVNVGSRRQMEALRMGLQDKFGFDGDGWGIHIEGACAEIAVAKATQRYWEPTVNTFKAGADVGSDIQVRRRSKENYDLLVRDGDNDNQIFIHVTGQVPSFDVHGWIWGHEAKQHKEWIKTHGGRDPAWFVPASALHPITELVG